MINTFISAIIALFFWGKASKDVEEKTQLASKTRTIVYFVLSVIVGIFFYKTYQVATVFTILQTEGIRESRDTLGNLADTISYISIENKFSTSNVSGREFSDWQERHQERGERESGGVYYKISMNRRKPYTVKNNPVCSDADIARLRIPLEDVGQIYNITTVNTTIPNLIPMLPDFSFSNKGTTEVASDERCYMEMNIQDLKYFKDFDLKIQHKDADRENVYSHTGENPLKNGYVGTMFFAKNNTNDYPYSSKDLPLSFIYGSLEANFINSMGFFTAADISQYQHVVQVNTDCHINKVELRYNIPIEVNSIDSNMVVGPLGFGLFANSADEYLKNKSALFLVKLPTLANLQLIRSLILTTLITALLSLFFANLFYVFRKWAIHFKEEHIQSISERRVIAFKRRIYIVLTILLLIMIYWAKLVLEDTPLFVPIQILDNIEYILGGFVLLLAFVIYFLFRKAYTTKKGN